MRAFRRSVVRGWLPLAAAVGCAACGLLRGEGPLPVESPVVRRAPEWDALFERASGWIGADAAYSVPLADGVLFLFGDTLIRGEDGIGMIRNSIARLEGTRPDPGALRFLWRRGLDGRPRAVFAPGSATEWYWPQDALIVDDLVWMFALKVGASGGEGPFDFVIRGTTLLSFPAGGSLPPAAVREHRLPDAEGAIFGGAVLGGPGDRVGDGFVYVYGWRESATGKDLLVARTPETSISELARWRYWNGTSWTADASGAVAIASRVSAELGVAPVGEGRWALIFQRDGVGRDSVARTGPSPFGPFESEVRLWDCPEAALARDVYCYNAKPHPELSGRDTLLVSYNVNRTASDPERLAEAYRPRFLHVPLELLDVGP